MARPTYPTVPPIEMSIRPPPIGNPTDQESTARSNSRWHASRSTCKRYPAPLRKAPLSENRIVPRSRHPGASWLSGHSRFRDGAQSLVCPLRTRAYPRWLRTRSRRPVSPACHSPVTLLRLRAGCACSRSEAVQLIYNSTSLCPGTGVEALRAVEPNGRG